MHVLFFPVIITFICIVHAQCPDYADYSALHHAPFSDGRYNLSSQRPSPACRTFNSTIVETTINATVADIADPDLARLFLNSFPNTLDTAIKWKGYAANGSDEELTFVITGDINAMWLRDSANQMQSYQQLLTASNSSDSLASLYRGVINLQSRYILTSPYCNAFQPPAESGIDPVSSPINGNIYPTYDNSSVFECKYELDSVAAFLEISSDYYTATQDLAFFGKYNWVETVEAILSLTDAMKTPTFAANGSVNPSPYSFQKMTLRGSETLLNNGLGSPVNNNTGLIRSAFRPSDDSTIYQFFIPANMMFSTYLSSAADIMRGLGNTDLADSMSSLSSSLRTAIDDYGIVSSRINGDIYAYEVDGYGGANIMDDANIPSLLSAAFFGFVDVNDTVYQNTRKQVLSPQGNPYFNFGTVLSSVGGPHDGPGYAWPMASIVRILTSSDDEEITDQLRQILSSTDGLGLIHESINTFDQSDWTRQWFSWANGLFGQMILDLKERKPHILQMGFQ
ncbi:hypothetical protein AAFC00_006489 [Neodothiora populina]|uniref:Glycoside hydrolase family 125 protein n=1 Tax=Neodothiora populina TaxID=2781224 RepID=A0ABR3P642_9PEZI